MITTLIIVAVVVAAIIAIAFFRAQAREEVRAAQADTARLAAVLDEVKDITWNSRELSPDLSTVIIETIRSGEERIRRRSLPN